MNVFESEVWAQSSFTHLSMVERALVVSRMLVLAYQSTRDVCALVIPSLGWRSKSEFIPDRMSMNMTIERW